MSSTGDANDPIGLPQELTVSEGKVDAAPAVFPSTKSVKKDKRNDKEFIGESLKRQKRDGVGIEQCQTQKKKSKEGDTSASASEEEQKMSSTGDANVPIVLPQELTLSEGKVCPPKKKVDATPAVFSSTKSVKKGKRNDKEFIGKSSKRQKRDGVGIEQSQTRKKKSKEGDASASASEEEQKRDSTNIAFQPKEFSAIAAKNSFVVVSKKKEMSSDDSSTEGSSSDNEDAQSSGSLSKTLFVDDLDFFVKKEDLVNFFKDVGEIVDICFAYEGLCFTCFGLVKFATEEAAKKAHKFHGRELLGCPTRVEFAREDAAYMEFFQDEQGTSTKVAFQPKKFSATAAKNSSAVVSKKREMSSDSSDEGNSSDDEDAQSSGTLSKTLFVDNLDFFVKKEDLVNLFKDVGEIVDICFAYEGLCFMGFSLVKFATEEAAKKARKVHGREISNPTRIEFAKEGAAYMEFFRDWVSI